MDEKEILCKCLRWYKPSGKSRHEQSPYHRDMIKEIDELRNICDKGGRKIYCVLRHVSRSGMMRHIDLYVILEGVPLWITGRASRILRWTRANGGHGPLKVGGCGMDVGFHTVYTLSTILYRGGDGVTVTGRNGDKEPETDGGYLLKQVWM